MGLIKPIEYSNGKTIKTGYNALILPAICDLYLKARRDKALAQKQYKLVTYSGSVVKRQVDKDEITFSGFVLRDSKDNRTFINIDTDYAAGVGDGMLGDLAYQLKIGRRIKITAYLCSHILYLKRVQLLP